MYLMPVLFCGKHEYTLNSPENLTKLKSTILSLQGNNETEQQSFFCELDQFFLFRTTRSVKLLLKTRLDKHAFM